MLSHEVRELFRAWMERRGGEESSDELLRKWEALSVDDRETLLREAWERFKPGGRVFSESESMRLFERIREGIRLQEDDANKLVKEVKVGRLVPRRRWRFSAVAAALLLMVAGWWVWRGRSTTGHPTVADVMAPAANRAMLTLANGHTITLDSAVNGTLAVQGTMQIKKAKDLLEYVPVTAAPGGVVPTTYNSLFNPRGSRVIHVLLADGSTVWLNAGSTLRYPVVFADPYRRVEFDGEAFFDVAANVRPFVVSKGGMAITVLGTRFNVNTYGDEPMVRVTLLAGKVRVTKGGDSAVLQPGQQAAVGAGLAAIAVRDGIDLDQVTAWMDDRFDFGEGTDLADIMRQVARWYDVDIQYSAPVNERFGGGVSREVNVSKVLEKFALTGRVHFRIEGRTIVVGP